MEAGPDRKKKKPAEANDNKDPEKDYKGMVEELGELMGNKGEDDPKPYDEDSESQ